MNSRGFRRSRCWFARRAGLLLVLALALGCKGGQGQVSGQVLYNGKPLPGGWIIFRPVDGRQNTVNAQLAENGTYEVTLPAGEVKIAVDNRELESSPADRGAGPALPPGVKLPPVPKAGGESPPAAPKPAPEKPPVTYVAIPSKYHDVDTSGLTYTVTGGPQSHDIELK
jgi:hypothetical protein